MLRSPTALTTSPPYTVEIRADDAYTGEPIQFVVVIKDGACTAAGTVADPEYDFAFRGPAREWVTFLQGDRISAAAMDDLRR